jgi:hypothetical protein
MGSVHARGDTFLTFGLKALTQTNTSRLATAGDWSKMGRWVKNDPRTMGVKRWRNVANDREEWRRIVKEARALHGP